MTCRAGLQLLRRRWPTKPRQVTPSPPCHASAPSHYCFPVRFPPSPILKGRKTPGCGRQERFVPGQHFVFGQSFRLRLAFKLIFFSQAWKRRWLQGLRSTSETREVFLVVFAVLLIAPRPQAVHGQGRKGALFYGRFEARARGYSEQGALRSRQQHPLYQ